MKLPNGIITQAQAARLRGVSRQRIEQLVKAGRLRQATSKGNVPIVGAVYQEDVLNLTEGKRGRPTLPPNELVKRRGHDLTIGEEVVWVFTPRDGFGFSVLVPATVTKVGDKRVRISFTNPVASDNEHEAWASPESLYRLDKLDALESKAKGKNHENGKAANQSGK